MTHEQAYTYDKYEIHNVKRTISNIMANVRLLERKIHEGKTEIKNTEACINQLNVVNVHLTQLLTHIDEEILISDIMNT